MEIEIGMIGFKKIIGWFEISEVMCSIGLVLYNNFWCLACGGAEEVDTVWEVGYVYFGFFLFDWNCDKGLAKTIDNW